MGGNRANELGALGKNATIKGGAGDDAIYGGPGHDTIFAGAGNDLIADQKGSATIHTGTGKNEVDVTGHTGRDRVLCAPGSVDRIYANRGDSIAPSCRKAAGSQVVYHQPAPIAADSAHVALSANGCTDNPDVDCAFVAAAGGPLKGLWWSQKTPARRCPPSHPYLRNEQVVHGTIGVVPGVNVAEIPQVDFFAGLVLLNNTGYVIGVDVGEVTNWTISSQDWHMWLYCTSDPNRGYTCANNACL